MEHRFTDRGEYLGEFTTGEVIVVCPRCSGPAYSRPVGEPAQAPRIMAPRRLTCSHCALVREWEGNAVGAVADRAEDGHFGLPLWLQTPCCGENLWACGERHLALLEDYVAARLRERTHDAESGWSNASLVSRLPAWLTAARNRDAVQKGLARLRARLEEAQRG